MRVLVACEFSGTVRRAFRERGHDAWSCDLLPSDKATCFWLKNLPRLVPTHIDDDLFHPPTPEEREQRLHKLPPGPDRWKERSKTYSGIANAMAEQWGKLL